MAAVDTHEACVIRDYSDSQIPPHEWRYRGETLEVLPMDISSGPALVTKHTYYCIYCLEERTIGTDTGPTPKELQHSGERPDWRNDGSGGTEPANDAAREYQRRRGSGSDPRS